ncbi:BBP7 family outer membrane beta-barrel protein [Botrimarina mediterranea]|uniref:Alginate export domain-containing protein n=1 Tax=Botrimarina mediterranea TaxID=2528022 RepID=A0A518KEW0_9BACT|nr:BBP7 family outer membrane beta-barrel protein [Botrimarina mediterranea]QDV76334.1 hypothetical protein Spa11_45640 [Botrimarina mediterranea]QDV80932.1 hypothetical protein K2D_45670 [Planctomycetes bacterium K2D]
MAHPVLRMLVAAAVSGFAAAASAQALPALADVPTYDPAEASVDAAGIGSAEAMPSPETVVAEMQGLQPIAESPYDGLALMGQLPAATESSGSWLRRGLWYADVDAVVMQRTWDSNGFILVQEFDNAFDQSVGSINAFLFRSTVPVQEHSLSESSPGYDGAGRLALGRFLFRDTANRDHNVEMVVFGGPEWNELTSSEAQLTEGGQGMYEIQNDIFGNSLQATLPPTVQVRDQRGLHIPASLDGSGPTRVDFIPSFASFDRARAMQTEYSSDFQSWEWNYSLAQRMRRDRMEMNPAGQWVRRAQPGFTWDYLAGLRYFDVGERFDWNAQGIVLEAPEVTFTRVGNTSFYENNDPMQITDTTGAMNIQTSNNLFGFQLGGGLTYETDRWNVSIFSKHGFMVNDARATTNVTFSDPDDASIALNSFGRDLHENGLSYLTQGGVTARYHLRPNLSLRVGWEFMYATGLALAPNQIDFNPATNQLHITGDTFYSGVTAGTEFYW